MGGNNSKPLEISDENLETFSMFWLDAQVNTTEDNRNTQLKLREIINHLKTFDDQNQVPQIHHLRQVSSIYLYCVWIRKPMNYGQKILLKLKVFYR